MLVLYVWLVTLLGSFVTNIPRVYGQENSTLPVGIVLYDGDTFDYIVVGAGAAGSAVAARLALSGADVLLVEAGGYPNLFSRIPGTAPALLGSEIDWAYETLPNNVSCLSSLNKQCRFSRGKCLGGSTSINYMMYTRGNHKDYNYDVPGWTWEEFKPYFLVYEDLHDLELLPPSSRPYHNQSGIMDIEYFADSENKWHEKLFQGYHSLNFQVNLDVNGPSQIGVSQIIGYVYKNERMTTARAYLADPAVKERLKVALHTKCGALIIDDHNVARGVQVNVLGGETKRVFAKKRVILSAGTVGTPQILMLSGVGPAEHLNSLNIPVKANLPVGDNLSDHVLPLIFIKVDRGFGLNAPNLLVFGDKAVQFLEYESTKEGPLASNGLTDVTAFINTKCYNFMRGKLANGTDRPECALPTLQLIHAYIDRNILQGINLQQFIPMNEKVLKQISDANVNHALIVISPVVLHPYSRGNIRLADTNPSSNPAIFPNYLSDERDVQEMLRSIRIVQDLVATPTFKQGNAEILEINLEGCPSIDTDRDGYYECYVRHMTYSVFHAVGTAALGQVVDQELRVKGVAGLSVADLSVLPRVPRGNTAAAAIALGERLADFILYTPPENSSSNSYMQALLTMLTNLKPLFDNIYGFLTKSTSISTATST